MRTIGTLAVALLGWAAALLPLLATAAPAAPDYGAWNQLLARYYDPARGMNYRDLQARDRKTLDELRQRLAATDPAALAAPDRLAYWINVYNVNVVATVVDHYPVGSIRDISTDWITRLNVFKKETVPVKGGMTALDSIENEQIRLAFKDPRIHFAINCAAVSCPPIRSEAYVGARLAEQLDDQCRRFLGSRERGARIEAAPGGGVVVHVTKVMDWFAADFNQWGGGQVPFIRRYLSPERQQQLDAAKGKVQLEFDPYDWKLNDASPR
jgi:Protein of unknown function, DUF547